MSLSDYLESKILQMVFHRVDYTPPSSYWLSLSTKNIGDDAIDNREPDGKNYSRIEIANEISETGFIQIGDYFYNSGQMDFPEVTGASWGLIKCFGLWDGQTNGNLIAYGSLQNNKTAEVGDICRIYQTGIKIGID